MKNKIIYFLSFFVFVFAIAKSIEYRWLADDAFISFQYAANLVEGKGLTFTGGERVEGFTNFLWTILLSAGILLKIRPEILSLALGIFFYSMTLISLLFFSFRKSDRKILIPLAFICFSIWKHSWIFATSGLETSSYTFFITSGLLFLFFSGSNIQFGNQIGLFLLSLACLSRPDGVLFYSASAFALIVRERNVKSIFFSVIFFLPVFGLISFRHFYYSDFFPNTYYAKSGYESWYSQGFLYLYLFLKSYPMLAVLLLFITPLLVLYSGFLSLKMTKWEDQSGIFVIAICGLYLLYVCKVGGDFMNIRFIFPVVPILLFVLEAELQKIPSLGNKSKVIEFTMIAVAVIACLFYIPLWKKVYEIYGVTEERNVYTSLDRNKLQYNPVGFENVNLAFFGAQAHFVYYLKPKLAIEAQTGLTDKWIARQPLKQRGKPGHEKIAPLSYLKQRNVNIVMENVYPELSEDFKNIYLNWNGFRLKFKILTYNKIVFTELKKNKDVDLSEFENWLSKSKFKDHESADMSSVH